MGLLGKVHYFVNMYVCWFFWQGSSGGWLHMCCGQSQPSAELAVEGMRIGSEAMHGVPSAHALQPVHAGAFRCMPYLRILVLDRTHLAARLAGFELPQLAMLSWRGAGGRALPFDVRVIKNAAVLDIGESRDLTTLPGNMQARSSSRLMQRVKPGNA